MIRQLAEIRYLTTKERNVKRVQLHENKWQKIWVNKGEITCYLRRQSQLFSQQLQQKKLQDLFS